MKRTLLAAAVLVSAATLQAQAANTFYKLVEPSGRTTYLDQPPSAFNGRVEVVTVDPDANTARLPEAMPAGAATEAERLANNAEVARLTSQQQAEVNLRRAEDNVARAHAALKNAQDNSVAEDWIYYGGATGTVRRGPKAEYSARLEALAANVTAAEANLAEAQREHRLSY